jgi:hypothetical protein
MGQTVYVLMMMEGGKTTKEWRPVGVVTDPAVAEQWGQYGKEVDWVPLELDDTSYLQPNENVPEFRPQKIAPIEQRAVETAKRLEETNRKLLKIIERMQKMLGIRGKVPMDELKEQQVPEPKKSSLFDDEEYNEGTGEV